MSLFGPPSSSQAFTTPKSNSSLERGKSLKRENSRKKISSSNTLQTQRANLEAKSTKELNKLRSTCRIALQHDLARLFKEEPFADLVIETDSFCKPCHSCFLITRVPDFYNNLLNFQVESCKGRSSSELNCYRIPTPIDSSQVQTFLQKVYCSETVEEEEVALCAKLTIYMSQSIEHDVKICTNHEDGVNHLQLMKEDSLENIKDASQKAMNGEGSTNSKENELKEISSQDSLKRFDSLELVTDSLNNISLSSDNKNQDSDFEDSLATPARDKENAACLTSSGSSQMVRSGTFDLLSSIPPDQTNFDCPIDQMKASSDCRPQIESLDLNDDRIKKGKSSTQEICDDGVKDNDIETPIADTSLNSSLFQFFIDIEQNLDSKKIEETSLKKCDSEKSKETSLKKCDSQKSGLIFIDLNSVESENSRTIEKEKRNSDSRMPKKKEKNQSNSIQSDHSRSETPNRSYAPRDRNNITKRTKEPQANLSYNVNRSISSSEKSINPKSCKKDQHRDTGSPLSSMDSGMLSSLNSEGVKADSDKWFSKADSIKSMGSAKHPFFHEENSDDGRNIPCSAQDSKSSPFMINRALMSCSRLGEDLLQMFLKEINTDITILTEGDEIRAHKCMLVCRSPYFSALFKGEWNDSQSSCISLKGFSYNSVHFALCHIYSGSLLVSDGLNLAELALLSNLLALDTLRDVVVYELEKAYCHFFHKPCLDCPEGVTDCLIVSFECGFTQLHQKCLSWIGKHFSRVWPTRSFASLPNSLINSCFSSTVNQLTPETIIETLLSCEKLGKTTPKVKWAEPIFGLIAKLMDELCNFMTTKYDAIVSTQSFISLGRSKSWNISAIEETFIIAMNSVNPDIGCKTLSKLDHILKSAESETAFGYGPYAENYVALVRKISRYCERSLVQNVNSAISTPSWSLLSPEIQQRIKDSAVIVFEFEKPLAPRPQLSSAQMPPRRRKDDLKNSSRSSSRETRRIHRSRLRNEGRSRNSSMAEDGHIYDEVTDESLLTDRETPALDETPANNGSQFRHRSGERKCQVNQVTPLTCRVSEQSISSTEGFVAAIDEESETINNQLHEARLLEQELSRKMQKNQKHKTSKKNCSHSSPAHLSSSPRNSSPLSRSGLTQKLRPPFK